HYFKVARLSVLNCNTDVWSDNKCSVETDRSKAARAGCNRPTIDDVRHIDSHPERDDLHVISTVKARDNNAELIGAAGVIPDEELSPVAPCWCTGRVIIGGPHFEPDHDVGFVAAIEQAVAVIEIAISAIKVDGLCEYARLNCGRHTRSRDFAYV